MIYPYGDRYKFEAWPEVDLQSQLDRYLDSFKRACSGLRGPYPRGLNANEWWVLGRHHGLVSPLLDWTLKPYVAAFFALTDYYDSLWPGPGGGEVAVYQFIYNPKDLPQFDMNRENHLLEVVDLTLDELPHLQGQRSLFTWLKSRKYFELQGYLDDFGKGDYLTQILLSGQAMMDGMVDLEDAGIDYRLLFPDIRGAAQHANDVERRQLVSDYSVERRSRA